MIPRADNYDILSGVLAYNTGLAQLLLVNE